MSFSAAARSAVGDSHGYLFLTEEQAGPVKVNVSQEKFHGAALGDFPGFVQIFLRVLRAGARAREKAQPRASEEGIGKLDLLTGAAKAVQAGGEVLQG